MNIYNTLDYRLAHEILLMYKEKGMENCEKAKELKRSIRRFEKKENEATIIKDNGMDGYTELVWLPEKLNSLDEEDVKVWFEESLFFIPQTYSAFDCTGRPFTSWFKVFRRRGRWAAYHAVGFDV